jgi:UDPglucose 6-dehydrogenase
MIGIGNGFTTSMPGTIGGAKIIFKDWNIEMIGIVGLGFVGGAIKNAFEESGVPPWGNLLCVDPAKGYTNTIEDLKDCDGIFVCVPTPQDDDGTCDTSPLEGVLSDLAAIGFDGVIISKCTAPADVYERLLKQYPNLVHAPEFLTAANANRDYINGSFSIIGGGAKLYLREAERIIRLSQPNLGDNVMYCSIGEAAMAKYTINCFMSTKVIFMNELYNLADKMGLDYNRISRMVTMDPRIGDSHMMVPGPDGFFGFGGACFPKDTSALLKTAEQQGVDMMVLDAAVKKNTLLRLTEPK